MDIGGTLIVYFAGACGFLLILGLSYLYRRIVHRNYHLDLHFIDNNEESNEVPTDVSFPVTLELMDKVAMIDEATLQFISPCSIQANYTLFKVAYFEIKLISLNNETSLYVGIAPKTISYDCIPGKIPNSIGVEISLRDQCPTFRSNDTIGLLFQPGKPISIIHNGTLKGSLPHPSVPLVPTLYADGPCKVQINFGQQPFNYYIANQGMGIVPLQSTLAQPPSYSRRPDPILPKYTRWTDPKYIPPV